MKHGDDIITSQIFPRQESKSISMQLLLKAEDGIVREGRYALLSLP